LTVQVENSAIWLIKKLQKIEIRQQGYKVLIDSLGIANTLQFLQQLGLGYGNYTEDRQQWLDQLTMDNFLNYVIGKQTNVK